MKFIIVFALFIAACLAADADTEILKNTYEQGETSYNFGYELSDGQARQEAGELKDLPNDDPGTAARGFYSFVGDDGVTYRVDYIADENGFQPSGAHLPQA